jgi:hypothetical protein
MPDTISHAMEASMKKVSASRGSEGEKKQKIINTAIKFSYNEHELIL